MFRKFWIIQIGIFALVGFVLSEIVNSYFKCKESNVYIPTKWVCDQMKDCPLSDDELKCKSICYFFGTFKCESGVCLAYSKVCDGKKDCTNGEDEERCNNYFRDKLIYQQLLNKTS